MKLPITYSVNELAEITGLSPRTIFNYIRGEQIHPIKLGKCWRFTEAEVKRFLDTGIQRNYLKKVRENIDAEKNKVL